MPTSDLMGSTAAIPATEPQQGSLEMANRDSRNPHHQPYNNRPRNRRIAAIALILIVAMASATAAQKRQRPLTLDEEYLAIDRAFPGFGGLFYDANDEANIYLTDLSRRDALRGLADGNVKFLAARYTFSQLYEWRARLLHVLAEPGVVFLDIDERRNRINVGVEAWRAAKGPEAVHALASQYDVPAAAILLTATEPIVPEVAFGSNLRDELSPTPGGMQIYSDGGSGSAFYCTMGFVAHREGKWGFVTNSHCTNSQGGVDGTHYQQPGSSGQPFGTETVDPAYRGDIEVYWGWWTGVASCASQGFTCRYSDSAFIELTSFSQGDFGQIAKPVCKNCNGNLDIDDGGQARFTISKTGGVPVGKTVHKVGRTTGWTSAKVLTTCIDISKSNNRLVLCQNQVENFTESGDSGSPVFKKRDDGTVKLVGIHWGKSSGTSVYSPFDQIELDLGSLGVMP